jgi:hypothetical protein
LHAAFPAQAGHAKCTFLLIARLDPLDGHHKLAHDSSTNALIRRYRAMKARE